MVSEQKFVDAYQQLFSEDAESIDPLNTSGQPLKGLATLLAREKDFLSRITRYSNKSPYLNPSSRAATSRLV